ncbi:MAG: imidazole glycerol phosphate synthase subunit HisH [Bradymonadaceae bacterium]
MAIVDTGVANIASMEVAFRRLDAEPELTDRPSVVEGAPYVVLPGVGSFGAGMEMLHDSDLVAPIRRRLDARRSTLAVCLGMQLLARTSDEAPGVEGLGVVDASVDRFPNDVRVPHFGWNEVHAGEDCELLRDGFAYFANSYRFSELPDGWAGATSEYGGRFVSAMECGPVLACQFHPELSSDWGLDLLERWLERGEQPC